VPTSTSAASRAPKATPGCSRSSAQKRDGAGFKLVGGRLDYLDRPEVAALAYARLSHVINLFVWPAAGRSAQPPRTLTNQGYHVIHRPEGDLACWAVSDLNEAELRTFVDLIRR
jgi:anti-sigma factor RsiW